MGVERRDGMKVKVVVVQGALSTFGWFIGSYVSQISCCVTLQRMVQMLKRKELKGTWPQWPGECSSNDIDARMRLGN